VCWQQPAWEAHLGNPCAFVGDATAKALGHGIRALGPGRAGRVIGYLSAQFQPGGVSFPLSGDRLQSVSDGVRLRWSTPTMVFP
jgi:hypothetical protein